MIVLTFAGLGVASYVTYVHYAGIKPVCTAGGSLPEGPDSEYSSSRASRWR